MKYKNISIIKRKDCNSWCARFRKNGKQFYVSAKTQKECYEKLKLEIKRQTKIELQALKEPTKPTLTLKEQNEYKKDNYTFIEWYNKWLNIYKKDVKNITKKDYNSSMNYLSEIKNLPLENITSINILEILSKIDFERRKQKVYEFLNDIFKKAKINKLISENPLDVIDKPKHKRKYGLAFSNEDEKKLIQILEEKNLDYFLICLYQGLRRGEMLALTRNDIDFENRLLTINKSLNKENKVDTTKNIYSNRVIPIFNNAFKILEKYKNVQGRIFDITRTKAESTFLKLVRENFNKKYTIHSLRHTFITNCQEKQIPLHIIQKWVGHNIGSEVTTKIYTHTRELAELENIEKMNS